MSTNEADVFFKKKENIRIIISLLPILNYKKRLTFFYSKI